ncbi:MAG: UDP-N-acetylglucosamine 2-epimerase (non-hydrolyzing) [Chloroflexi bacterium]|nr:UDP-N-acetylglucosamine 2-epimerase (non-hydrolyzing) [Chloroflexota bacterium]
MKVMVVFGTRPEAIKLAPVIRELRQQPASRGVQTVVCVTGQHRQMLEQVLGQFGVAPEHDLRVMEEDQTPAQVAGAVLSRLDPILTEEHPDWVLVQGDTITAAAASLGAFYQRIRVGHVEAGLRTYDKWQPFPEEMNRRVVGLIADFHFAPTQSAKQNLLREGVPSARILVTGNPVIDALHWISEQVAEAGLGDKGHRDARLILVTAHRRENFGRPLENICLALRDLAERYQGRVRIVYPVHLNPNVRGPVGRLLGNSRSITLLPPADYLTMVRLMQQSTLILTDSGGIQEEAPSLGKPVLVLRDVTERPEAVAAGAAKLVGTDRKRIVAEASRLLDDPNEYARMARAMNPYGDGKASRRIVASLLGKRVRPFAPSQTRRNAKAAGM